VGGSTSWSSASGTRASDSTYDSTGSNAQLAASHNAPYIASASAATPVAYAAAPPPATSSRPPPAYDPPSSGSSGNGGGNGTGGYYQGADKGYSVGGGGGGGRGGSGIPGETHSRVQYGQTVGGSSSGGSLTLDNGRQLSGTQPISDVSGGGGSDAATNELDALLAAMVGITIRV
jgi:hypothetical protein